MNLIKQKMKSLFQAIGIDIKYYVPKRTDIGSINTILKNLDIDLVFDIGANCGQYSKALINMGYKGKIVSFEPLTKAHLKLKELARSYENWIVHDRSAIGNVNSQIEINIASNSESSSILPILERHLEAAPNSKYVSKEVTPIFRLDDISEVYINSNTRLYIKIDTQGFEWEVLDGAQDCLRLAKAIQIELSFVPLYENQHLWKEIVERMESLGFDLWLALPGFTNYDTGRTLQMDVVFVKP